VVGSFISSEMLMIKQKLCSFLRSQDLNVHTLETSLKKGLTSRSQRSILRRLPNPDHAPSSSSSFIDFTSNDYISLATSPVLRTKFLKNLSEAPNVLGSGGSRLLVNGRAHATLEERLAKFFNADAAALLFNSGFDANVGFFSCIPQAGDVLVHNEYIHASVHDGMRASRVKPDEILPFEHNSVDDFRRVLERSLIDRDGNPFVRS